MPKSKVVAIVQARMTSTRLPGKVLQDIEGKPMLGRVIERLQWARLIDQIVIAVAVGEKNKPILDLCKTYSVDIFFGNEADVLDRYYQAAKGFNADVIVRITSDCPMVDPQIVDKVVKAFLDNTDKTDYASNTVNRTYPRGLDVETFSFKVLEIAWKGANKPYQREHVTPFMRENPQIFGSLNIENHEDLSFMRWTVDERKDLEFARELYKRAEKEIPLMDDFLLILEKEPYLQEINCRIEQKELR